ncbi:Alpha/Beta hydrolase protein [Aspergillus venezuelensis]
MFYFRSVLSWAFLPWFSAHAEVHSPFSAARVATDPSIGRFSVQFAPDTACVCNSSTPGTAGTITSEDVYSGKNSMFFWLFESKHNPDIDPVILWMTGGPGASSVGYGNLMEIGPCRIAPGGGYTVPNEFGWNTNATVIFVDQPVGVGYSRGERIPNGIVESSLVMHRFLRQFFLTFPDLTSRDFYIAGESYGGSWVPALATTILQSQTLEEALAVQGLGLESSVSRFTGGPAINLKGIIVGNGLIRQSIQNRGFFETACSGPESLFEPSECLDWAPRAMWCEKNLGICESKGMTSSDCKLAEKKCSAISAVILEQKHRNPYDFRRECADPPKCYSELYHIDEYLNRTDIKEAMGVEDHLSFAGLSNEVLQKWDDLGDLWRPSDKHVNYLLNSGIRVLIYAGDKDLYCNTAGMRLLVDHGLNWYGQPFIQFRELMPWYNENKVAGRWKSFEPLTYAEIAGGGHLAPFDKPQASLNLINSWIKGQMPAL